MADAFTHGSAEQRERWFRLGFESGSRAAQRVRGAVQGGMITCIEESRETAHLDAGVPGRGRQEFAVIKLRTRDPESRTSHIAAILGFLNDETRRDILLALARHGGTAAEVADRLGLSRRRAQYHLRRLLDRRLLDVDSARPRRFKLASCVTVTKVKGVRRLSVLLDGGSRVTLEVS